MFFSEFGFYGLYGKIFESSTRELLQILILRSTSVDMSLQSLPSRNFSDSDPITPWEQKKSGGRKVYVLVCMLMNMFPKFHIFWMMGTFLVRDINVLPPWLINLPIYKVARTLRVLLTSYVGIIASVS